MLFCEAVTVGCGGALHCIYWQTMLVVGLMLATAGETELAVPVVTIVGVKVVKVGA